MSQEGSSTSSWITRATDTPPSGSTPKPVTSLEFVVTDEEATQLASHFSIALTVNPKVVTVLTYYKGEKETESRVRFEDNIEAAVLRKSADARTTMLAVASKLAAHSMEPAMSEAHAIAVAEIDDDSPLWSPKTVAAVQSYTAIIQSWIEADVNRVSFAVQERVELAKLVADGERGDPASKAREWTLDNMPAFIYFSDYGQLETRLHLPTFLKRKDEANDKIRTQLALFEHSNLDPQEMLSLGVVKQNGEILLLDEPGLHLHPKLQEELIQLFDRIAEKNQLIYSTHLPFLIDGNHLDRVRTVYLDGPKPQKTVVSSNIRQGADEDTLFVLQAAIGYSIAQTLFLGKRSVIVEGITGYWILKALNDSLLGIGGFETLNDETILIPTGGTSRLMPLASIMFAVTGVGDKKLLVLLDSDKEGRNASARVVDTFGDDSRVLMLGSAFGQTNATIEDLLTREVYADAVRQSGKAFTLSADEENEPGNVAAMQKVFARLNMGEFGLSEKVSAALKLIESWSKNPQSISQETRNKASAVFAAINKKFTTT